MENNYTWIIEGIGYYPVFGSILPDGHLRIAISGMNSNGERWDGYETIGLQHKHYELWRQIIENKETILRAMKDERAKRRAKNKSDVFEERKSKNR
ncbi:MAG: hypothetical protein AB1757_04690 [Acidobacteriota bacterium]